MKGNLRFKIDWANLIVGKKFSVFALYSEGRFNGGFLPYAFGAGLNLEGLIIGILRYCVCYTHTWTFNILL